MPPGEMVCVDMSRGTAYGIGFSQVAITLAVLLYCPPVVVQVFTVHPFLANGTLQSNQDGIYHTSSWVLSLPLVMASGITVMFSTTTMSLHKEGLGGYDYQYEALEQYSMWDFAFWVYCLVLHAIIVLAITTPVDVFCMLLSTAFMVYFLHRVCAPKSQQVFLTQENMNILGYCVGAGVAAYSIPNANSARMTLLLALVALDYCVGIGHTWDRQATLDTITNCRLFYTILGSLLLAGTYATWGDTFAMA